MADSKQKAAKQLREITECPICMNAFNDPRMLPCIHTFCFECLKRTGEEAQMKPGDKMPCSLCRKEFIIPADGMNGVQKNFFMENLLQYKMTLQTGAFDMICDICNESKTGEIPRATMRCLDCQENYCESCTKVHHCQKISRNHQMAKIGNDAVTSGDRPKYVSSVKYCFKHTQKPLDYYCAECREIVCVSCFVEGHKSHDCKDIATVDKEFREMIEMYAWKISNYADEMLAVKADAENRKADLLKDIIERQNAINKRSQELKEIIDRDTKSLLDELSVVKSNLLKKMEDEVEIIDTSCTILRSFEAYCTELKSKGSAWDICSSIDQLIDRADELEYDHEIFIGRPHKSFDVVFSATDLGKLPKKFNNNIVGILSETTAQFEKCIIVVGLDCEVGTTLREEVNKINLHRPYETSDLQPVPTMMVETFAAVYCNTIYITGIGLRESDEIWKYDQVSGWMKCGSMVHGRRKHSSAFIDEVLYICGGYGFSTFAEDSVEAYNAVTQKCTTVGKLLHGVLNVGNCVPFKDSLYLFGGSDHTGDWISHVQVYDTKKNTCTLLSKPMPRPCNLMRAVLYDSRYVILVGVNTCFIYDFETEIWLEREQFKASVFQFGLVLDNERLYVIGGGDDEPDEYGSGNVILNGYDDVCYVPLRNIFENRPTEWKIHGKLQRPSALHACASIRFLV